MKKTLIAIDRPLRDLLSALAVSLGSSDVGPIKIGQILLEDSDHRVEVANATTLDVRRRFAGFNWRFEVAIDQLADIVTGAIREIPMERISSAESSPAAMNEGAIGRLLDSLGFEEANDSQGETLETDDRKPQLTGLEDGLEEEADFGSVSELDLDDFLAAYEAATKPPKARPKAEPEPTPSLNERAAQSPVTPATEHESESTPPAKSNDMDALGRLFAEISQMSDGDLADDELDEDASDEEVGSARGFLELLIKNDKMELADDADVDALSVGLAPILAMEERHRVKVEAILDWLLDQDDVEDVFASDDELIALIRAW